MGDEAYAYSPTSHLRTNPVVDVAPQAQDDVDI
jgi:hypothetical protein